MNKSNISSSGTSNLVYIVGSRGVGKTSLLNVLLGKGYNENITHSKIGIQTCLYQMGDRKLIFKDLTDNDKFYYTNILINQLEEVILVIVIFSIDDEESLQYATNLIRVINENITYNVGMKIILFGNKYDSKKINDAKIKVNQYEAESYALDFDNCSYYELSCKTGHNVSILENIINELTEKAKIVENKDDIKFEESVRADNARPSGSCNIY